MILARRYVSACLFLLELGICMSSALAQTPGTFIVTRDLTTPRLQHTATLLLDGRVLIAGGSNGDRHSLASAEIYDPSTGIFRATVSMTTARSEHAAVLLPNGQVLIAGGYGVDGRLLASTEIYDPSTGVFTAAADMIEAQSGASATLLPNGTVLMTGGAIGGSDCCPIAAPELYDPLTGVFRLAAAYVDLSNSQSANEGRIAFPATLLPSGSVLTGVFLVLKFVASGDFTVLTTAGIAAEVYSISAATFKVMGPAQVDSAEYRFYRYSVGGTSTLLPDGEVLLTGGDDGCDPAGAELADRLTDKFEPTGKMINRWMSHTATPLPDGKVLIAGGATAQCDSLACYYAPSADKAELYDPVSGTFSPAGTMVSPRESHTATLLNDGRILIAGGGYYTGIGTRQFQGGLASAELYTPPVLLPAPVLLSLSGDGQGQGAIQHANTVRIASAEDPAVAGEYLSIYLTGLADGSVIPPQIAIGGRLAELTFFGKVPGYPGLNVVNVRMPAGVTPGPAVPVSLRYLGRSSNGVTVGVR